MSDEAIRQIEAEYAAKIEAARLGAQELRESAFIDAPFLVAGVPLRAMCIPDFLALIASGNAHVTGIRPAEGDDLVAFVKAHNAQLMWALSPGFAPCPKKRAAFISKVAALPFEQVCADLSEYLAQTFADSQGASTSDAEPVKTNPIRVSFAAAWIVRLASRLHWSRSEIMRTPLKEIFQLFRLLDAEDAIAAGKSAGGRLSDEVDRLWAEMLGKINALNAPTV